MQNSTLQTIPLFSALLVPPCEPGGWMFVIVRVGPEPFWTTVAALGSPLFFNLDAIRASGVPPAGWLRFGSHYPRANFVRN